MIRVTHFDDDGTEIATVDFDDFTIEIIYSGLAERMREAAAIQPSVSGTPRELTHEARRRRQRVLSRIRD
jgi:hypothetical protein